MMEILYAKQWSDSIMVGATNFMAPLTTHHDTKTFGLKIQNESNIEKYENEWKSIGVKVENKIKNKH